MPRLQDGGVLPYSSPWGRIEACRLKLKTDIFLWVFLATVVPLTLLVLGATTYSERRYQNEVAREITSSLSNMVSEVDRTLYYERQMVLALANAPDMRGYLPVLAQASRGALHPEFFPRTQRLNQFLAAFQGVVPSFSTLRVLDTNANTTVKVRFGRGSVGGFDGIESFPYAEAEPDDPRFVRKLKELPPNDLNFVALPESRWDRDGLRGPPMLDAVVPLALDGKVVGYLMADFSGEQVDRVLELAQREHKGDLLIAELNPDQPDRDGMLLYDDVKDVRFSKDELSALHLRDYQGGRLWNAVHSKPYGDFSSADGLSRTYYVEYLPYSNQLASWVVAERVDMRDILEPFNRIRLGILVFAGVALLLSLFLARLGARKIAAPVTGMAASMKSYADGDHSVRVQAAGADEIRQLETSFNYMADTLERAQEERDRARNMMMQSAKLASIGQMAAGIGHEINNPLNNILSLTKLLGRSLPEDADKARRDLASLREEALRASEIVKGVLNFARQVPPHYSRFHTAAWLQETLALVQQAARGRGVELTAHLAEDAELEGDRVQLQQVLVNLLLNAIQASPAGAAVTVRSRNTDAGLELRVVDEGTGIEPEWLERVFDPFFTTKPVGEGSGLGLSISLGIVERHQGRLEVANNPDGGATATVMLPWHSA